MFAKERLEVKLKGKDMKKAKKNIDLDNSELLPEYIIDYSKVKRNPYFTFQKLLVEIDEDVVKAFESEESINEILKSIVNAMPKKRDVALETK